MNICTNSYPRKAEFLKLLNILGIYRYFLNAYQSLAVSKNQKNKLKILIISHESFKINESYYGMQIDYN